MADNEWDGEEEEITQENRPEGQKRNPIRATFRLIGRILVFLVTLALVAAAIFLVVNRDRISVYSFQQWWSYRTTTGENVEQFSMAGEVFTSCAAVEKDVLTCGEKGFWLYNRAGELVLEQQTVFSKPVLSVTGDYALVYDAGGSELYLIYQEQIIYRYAASDDYPLLSVRVSENGWLTIVEEASGYKAAVTVYNAAFQTVLKENISSAFVSDAILSPDHGLLSVASFGEDSSGFRSVLIFYNLSDGSEEYRCELGGDVVLDMDWENSGLWVMGQYGSYYIENGMISASYIENAQFLQGFSLRGSDFAAFTFSKYQGGGAGSINVLTSDGSIHSTGISEAVLSVSAAGEYFAVLTASSLTVYTVDMTVFAVTVNSWSAQQVLLRDDGSALLVSGDTVNFYRPDE